jgi:molybdopterin synthase sulfur carrier subunit
MGVEILFFGQLTEKVGCNHFVMENPGNISLLKTQLFEKFPALEKAKFTIAINNKLALEDSIIHEDDKIALMPPFSGG